MAAKKNKNGEKRAETKKKLKEGKHHKFKKKIKKKKKMSAEKDEDAEERAAIKKRLKDGTSAQMKKIYTDFMSFEDQIGRGEIDVSTEALSLGLNTLDTLLRLDQKTSSGLTLELEMADQHASRLESLIETASLSSSRLKDDLEAARLYQLALSEFENLVSLISKFPSRLQLQSSLDSE